jgi:hypothetical protein
MNLQLLLDTAKCSRVTAPAAIRMIGSMLNQVDGVVQSYVKDMYKKNTAINTNLCRYRIQELERLKEYGIFTNNFIPLAINMGILERGELEHIPADLDKIPEGWSRDDWSVNPEVLAA